MDELSLQNLRMVYRELDEVGVAISVVGTRRKKLMGLVGKVLPIVAFLRGSRPEVKRVRDDLVRIAFNTRRAQTQARPASKAVKALASQIKEVERVVRSGLGNAPKVFQVGDMILLNIWGYTEKEINFFVRSLEKALKVIDIMGLDKTIGTAQVFLDPESSQRSMTYDLFSDTFSANPLKKRERMRGISDAIGGRLWLKLFDHRDVETWGGSSVAWSVFSEAFFRLLSGKRLDYNDAARMTVSLGRIVGPERWKKVA